ncbi:restriction endonuclease subunit S [Vibrio cholerae]|uniref:restriction endonuclease subunit S n=1 Tax=Vibrio cholerae TaxID=666 RepID=UPI002D83A256|nr:restriction endonuclease subunit S [Vibrio cholerae]MEB5596971.1 restriction endonuclease subunit S [Vibrio cholerae]
MIRLESTESLPQGWRWVDANSVMDVRDGTHDSPKSVEAGIPLVTSKNLVGGKIDFSTCNLITEDDHIAISKRSAVDDGDILYAMIGTIGNPVIVEKQFEFSIKNVALFKFGKSNQVYNRYIYHFLNSDLAVRQFKSNSRGGTQKFVSLGNIRDLQIPLPPLAEQKRIAAILDKADAIRRKRQQAIQLADEFLRAVFLEMFGNLVTPNGYQLARKFKIKELVDYIDYRGKTPEKSDSGITLITAKNVKKGFIDDEPREYIPEENYENWMTRGIPQENDVLFTTEAPLGNVALLGKYDKVVVGQRLIALRSKGLLTQEYLLCLLLHPFVQGLINNKSSGSTVTGIRTKELYEIELPVPEKAKQENFSEIYWKINALKVNEQNSLVTSREVFDSLSQKAFSGQL